MRLQQLAEKQNWSLAEFVELLLTETVAAKSPVQHHDLDHLCGTWVEDPEFDAAMRAMDDAEWEFLRREREERYAREGADDPAVDRT